jgi:hypothetical protein
VPAGSARRLVGALAVGAPVAIVWYVRNLLATGNPLGLVPLTISGVTVLDGGIARDRVVGATLAALSRPSKPSHWAILAAMWRNQVGMPFVASSVLALHATVRAIRERRRATSFVATFALGALALYVITPYSGALGPGRPWSPRAGENLRYVLPFVGAVAGLAAVGIPARTPHGLLAAVGVVLLAGLGRWVVVSAAVGAMVVGASRVAPGRLRRDAPRGGGVRWARAPLRRVRPRSGALVRPDLDAPRPQRAAGRLGRGHLFARAFLSLRSGVHEAGRGRRGRAGVRATEGASPPPRRRRRRRRTCRGKGGPAQRVAWGCDVLPSSRWR